MQPIDIHYAKMEEWLVDRRTVFEKKHPKEYALCIAAAPQLVQCLRYDIPNMKKNCSRLLSQRDEIVQAIHNTPALVLAQKEKKRAFLDAYGIHIPAQSEGAEKAGIVSLEQILEGRVEAAVVAVSHGVAKAIPAAWSEFRELYQVQWKKIRSGETKSEDVAGAHFPWVSRLVEDAPLVLESIGAKTEVVGEKAAEDDAGAVIDWGDEPEGAVDLAEGAVAIQWDDDEGEAALTTSATEKTEDAPPPSQGSSPSIDLSRAEHRIHITQELEAAQCFLQERVRQLLHDSNVAFPSSSKSASSSVPQWLELDSYAQSFCPRETAVGLKLFQVLSLFENPHHTIELFHMRQMYRQKEQWLEQVEAMDRVLSNAQQRNTQLKDRLAATEEQLATIEPQLKERIDFAKETQKQCVAAIEKIFPGREVTMSGANIA